MADETRKIEKSVRIRADADAVWKALTEGEEIARWFAPEARVKPGVGGSIFVSWGPDMAVEEKIVLWEPPRHFRYAFGIHAPSGVPLYVDYIIEGDGGETTLRLVHNGFAVGADWDDEYESTDRGWSIFLRNLKLALERHAGRPCTQSVFSRRTTLSREDAWARLVGPPGFDRDGAWTGRIPEEGDRFDVTTAKGTPLRGTVEIFHPARDLALTLGNLDDTLFRLAFERAKAGTLVFGTILAYGMAPAAVAGLGARFQETLGALDET